MAIYEFQCLNPSCDQRFDEVHHMSNIPDEVKCNFCGSKAKRITFPGAPSLHFKGKGFYVTDNKAEKAAEPKETSNDKE